MGIPTSPSISEASFTVMQHQAHQQENFSSCAQVWWCGLVTKSCPTLATPWTATCQAPLSMGFSRQEYWSGFLCPPPVDLPDPCTGRWVLTSSITWEVPNFPYTLRIPYCSKREGRLSAKLWPLLQVYCIK